MIYIEIFLNAKFVTPQVFNQLSTEIPTLGKYDNYEGFFVCPNPTGYEWYVASVFFLYVSLINIYSY